MELVSKGALGERGMSLVVQAGCEVSHQICLALPVFDVLKFLAHVLLGFACC
jgi:hypothetical protein